MAYSVEVTPDQEAGFESYEELLGDTTQLGTPVSSLFASFNFTKASGDSDTPIRGSQTLGFDDITAVVDAAKSVYRETPEKLDSMLKEGIERFIKVAPRPLEEFPIKVRSGQVNFLNGYQEGDDDLPLQFQYQAGDCRLYYTVENIYRPETMWKSAKEAISVVGLVSRARRAALVPLRTGRRARRTSRMVVRRASKSRRRSPIAEQWM